MTGRLMAGFDGFERRKDGPSFFLDRRPERGAVAWAGNKSHWVDRAFALNLTALQIPAASSNAPGHSVPSDD